MFLPPWQFRAIKDVEELKEQNEKSLLAQCPKVVREACERFQQEYPQDSIKVNFTKAINSLFKHGRAAQYAKAAESFKEYKEKQAKLQKTGFYEKENEKAFKIADEVSLKNANALLRVKADPELHKIFKQMLDENWHEEGFFEMVYEPASSSQSTVASKNESPTGRDEDKRS
jgi:hypothetical protein